MVDSTKKNPLLDSLQSSVHVWYCNPLTISDRDRLKSYQSILSPQEVAQYHRFHFDEDKHSYLVSHALLRHVLSKYADVALSDWQYTKNEHGKPELIRDANVPDLKFNISHTHQLCACVISLHTACGIDAEYTNRQNNLRAIAQRMFAQEELILLNDDDNMRKLFFYFWTLRESYVKAIGTGLGGSSKEFYFKVSADETEACIQHNNGSQNAGDSDSWQFKLYEPTQEHVLSVAVQSQIPMRVRVAELIP